MAAITIDCPGTPGSVRGVRRRVRALMAGSPRAGDLELIACELMTNAIRHTASGRPGGTFTVTIWCGPQRARVEVADPGNGPWRCPAGDIFAESGRGLLLVAALADQAGHETGPGGRHRSWAEVAW